MATFLITWYIYPPKYFISNMYHDSWVVPFTLWWVMSNPWTEIFKSIFFGEIILNLRKVHTMMSPTEGGRKVHYRWNIHWWNFLAVIFSHEKYIFHAWVIAGQRSVLMCLFILYSKNYSQQIMTPGFSYSRHYVVHSLFCNIIRGTDWSWQPIKGSAQL